jgi:hypothetical protein
MAFQRSVSLRTSAANSAGVVDLISNASLLNPAQVAFANLS